MRTTARSRKRWQRAAVASRRWIARLLLPEAGMETNRLSQLMTLTCGGQLARPVTRAQETMLAVLAIAAALALSSLWGIAAGSASAALSIANAYKVPMVILLSALTALPAGLVALRLTNAKLTASELAGSFALA